MNTQEVKWAVEIIKKGTAYLEYLCLNETDIEPDKLPTPEEERILIDNMKSANIILLSGYIKAQEVKK